MLAVDWLSFCRSNSGVYEFSSEVTLTNRKNARRTLSPGAGNGLGAGVGEGRGGETPPLKLWPGAGFPLPGITPRSPEKRSVIPTAQAPPKPAALDARAST